MSEHRFMGMFPLNPPEVKKDGERYSEHEREILDKVAKKVIHWKMTVPAIMALESIKPLNYIGSQAMVFFEPMVQSLLNIKDYDTFRIMLEKRETIEELLLRIEHFDSFARKKEKLFNKLKKEYLRTQTTGFRIKSAILGFRVPKHLEEEWKAKFDAIDNEASAAPKPPESQST